MSRVRKAVRVKVESTVEQCRLSKRPVSSIVFFGEFGPASISFARSCHSRGIAVYLLVPGHTRDVQRAQSRAFAGVGRISPALPGTPEGITAVLDYVRLVAADALATISEAHALWISACHAQFDGVCAVLVPRNETLRILESKMRQVDIARKAGLAVLPTYIVRVPEDVAAVPPEAYPLCLRPATRNAVVPAFKVAWTASEKDLLLRLRSDWSIRDALVGQPFRALPNMIVHGTSSEGGSMTHMDVFLADRKFEGLSLRIRPMAEPHGLSAKIEAFARIAGLSGAYHFDFLYEPSTGCAYFLEVNARFGGTTDKVLWLGVDEPVNCLVAYGLAVGPARRQFRTRRKTVSNKRAELKHIFTMMRREPYPWDYPVESRVRALLRSVADLILTRDSVWDRHDLKGTLAFQLQGFR